MADEDTTKEPKENLLRGGDAGWSSLGYIVTDTGSRIFSEAVDLKKKEGATSHNPAKPYKLALGVGFAVASGFQTFEDIADGNYSDAGFHGAQTLAITSTSVPAARKGLGRLALSIPGMSNLAGVAASVSDWIHVKTYEAGTSLSSTARSLLALGTKTTQVATDIAEDAVPVLRNSAPLVSETAEQAAKKLPVVGSLVTLGMGAVAAGARYREGDTKGAGGELVVAAAGATAFLGVMAATTVASGLCGPFAAACAAATIPAATGVAFLASEVASEAAARMYNYANGTDVNGSAMMVLGKFADKRLGITNAIKSGIDYVADSSAPAPVRLAARGMQLAYRHTDDLVDYAYKGISSWFEEEPEKSSNDIDTQLNAHSAALKKYSKILDKDRDGKIEAHEIKQFVGADGVRDLQAAAKNGLSLSEVVKEVQEQMTENQSKQLKALIVEARQKGYTATLDSNGDGKFDMKDVNILRKTGVRLDQNSDGNISGGEFIRALKSAKSSLGGRD